MTDQTTTIAEIRAHMRDFNNKRGWTKDQNAKDLAMALSVEVSEIAEIFQWLHSDNADSVMDDPAEFEHLRDEISDTFWYLMGICEHFDIDLASAVENKTVKNAVKYPEL